MSFTMERIVELSGEKLIRVISCCGVAYEGFVTDVYTNMLVLENKDRRSFIALANIEAIIAFKDSEGKKERSDA